MKMKTVPTLVRAADLAAYSPANHTGTSNVRVICPETVGATALEVLIGTIVKSHSAKPTRIRTWSNAPHDRKLPECSRGRVEARPPAAGPCRLARSIRFA
jgi:hypothetical protein